MACEVLLVAAFHPELAPLRAALGEALRGPIDGREVVARAVGIGLPMAAVGTAMQLAELQPRRVVLLGTCGAYSGSGLRIGEVVAARRILLADAAVGEGRAQFPEPMSIVAESHGPTVEALVRAGARAADVATTLAITVDDATAERVSRATGTQAEHLEAYGVVTACAARGVPCGVALGVANIVGSGARDEWRVHHRQAASAAVEVALRALRDVFAIPGG
jgi:nucleoside phosphorylase